MLEIQYFTNYPCNRQSHPQSAVIVIIMSPHSVPTPDACECVPLIESPWYPPVPLCQSDPCPKPDAHMYEWEYECQCVCVWVCVSTRTHSRVLICCLFGFFCFVFAFALLGQPSPLILGKRMMLRDTYERVHNMLPFFLSLSHFLSHSYSWWLSLRPAVPVLVHLCVNLCIQIGKYRICGSCPPSAASQSVAQRRKQTATAK